MDVQGSEGIEAFQLAYVSEVERIFLPLGGINAKMKQSVCERSKKFQKRTGSECAWKVRFVDR